MITSAETNIAAIGQNSMASHCVGVSHDISHAILNNELCLHYQPRYNTTTGKLDILEALVRWRQPNRKLFYPEVFISQAEKNGLIVALDLWVFERCCKDLLWLQENINPEARISINISVHACENISFLQKIIRLSDKYRINLSSFEFEITECAHTHDIRRVTTFCENLKNNGVNFSLDDFCTGPSPIIKLWRLANTAAINRDFIQGIGKSSNSEGIIRKLVENAREISIHIVAEGIENEEQYSFISDLGCDQLQGYLLCRPLTLKRIQPDIMQATDIMLN